MSFASTIAELTQQQGRDAAEARRDAARIAAQALTSNAEAASRAAGAKGAIWGNAISNIGQSIAQIPQEINRGKMIDLQTKEMESQAEQRKAQTAKLQKQESEDEAVDRAFQESRRPDGTVDLEMFSSKIPGSAAARVLPVVQKVNEAAEADKQHKATTAAHAFFSAYKGGTPASLVTAAKLGSAAGAMTPEDVQQIQQLAGAIAQGPPEAQEGSTRALAAHLGAHFPQFQDLLDADTGKQAGLAKTQAETEAANALTEQRNRPPEKKQTVVAPGHTVIEDGKVVYTAPEATPKASTIGTFEDYLKRTVGNDPTPAQILKARKDYNQSDDKTPSQSGPGFNAHITKVEHKDPVTGKTIVEYLPLAELSGKKFEKGTGATTESRLASAQAVTQTGNDIIADLSNPAVAAKVGPAMGRFNSLREMLGNPPPELSELAGKIESYSLANMGVHGMRSVQGSREIAKLLDQKHTPASLISAIKGLNGFASHFLENEGRNVPEAPKETAGPPVGTVRTYNGETRKWTGSEWVLGK